jgi:modification target Cys-rich repeat protein
MRLRPLLLVSLVVVPVVHCNGDTTQVVCLTDLGTSDAGKKVQGFIETSNALITAAGEIDSDMLNACRSMAASLGIPTTQLDPPIAKVDAPGAATETACQRVAREIDKIVHDDLAPNAHLAIVYTPSVCTVDAEAQLRCEQQCDPMTVTATRLECKPGKLYGQCMGSCMGTCTANCAATCTGTCTGACTGTCSGSCNGMCAGVCSSQNANGTCYGSCVGTCTGTCDGTCTGSCSAICTGTCGPTCQGSCEGTCSTWVQPPQCTEVQERTTVTDCKTNCAARARFQAKCTEPSLTVTYGYIGTPAQEAALQRLATALRSNYARILKVGTRASVVVRDAAAGYAIALAEVTPTANQIGLGAGVCVADAITRVAGATAKVDVSVKASVTFSASISAMGGFTGP